jgi:lipopolysaccharide/colanic/teichoic acid biosynthesis glycosyltransferase
VIVCDDIAQVETLEAFAASLRGSGARVIFFTCKRSADERKQFAVEPIYEFNFDPSSPQHLLHPGRMFVDVYTQLFDLARFFRECGIAVVMSAGGAGMRAQLKLCAWLSGSLFIDYPVAAAPGASVIREVLEGIGAKSPARNNPLPNLVAQMVVFAGAVGISRRAIARQIYLPVKRAVDFVVATLLLLLTLPVVATICAVRLASGRSPLEKTNITGKDGKRLTLLSFDSRAVVAGNCASGGSRFWWLPSLINVVRGDVALVGPRLRAATLNAGDKGNSTEMLMRPGLTGWAQLKARSGVSDEQLAAMDQTYMLGVNALLDVKILIGAALSVLH